MGKNTVIIFTCRPDFTKLKTAFTFIWNKIQTLQITLIFNLCNLTFVELEKEVWAKKTKLFSNTSEESTFKISKISDETKSIFFSFLNPNCILLFLCKVYWTLHAKTQMNIKGFLLRTVNSKITVFMIFFLFSNFNWYVFLLKLYYIYFPRFPMVDEKIQESNHLITI